MSIVSWMQGGIAIFASVAVMGACSEDYTGITPREAGTDAASEAATVPVDASGEASTDAQQAADADDGSDGASACKDTPMSCSVAAKACSNNCKVTYNSCVVACPNDGNLMNCLNTCKTNVTSCQVPCKGDCVTCANANGSCTGSVDCEAQMYRP